jgi:hypothetical protein
MERGEWRALIDQLRGRGIRFAAPLSDAEAARAEGRFGFRFPP